MGGEGASVNALDRLLIGSILATGALFAGTTWVQHYGTTKYAAGHAAAIAERAAADAKAVTKRANENTAVATHQAASNANITEEKHEETQPVRERIVTQRVYVGSAICGERPAAPTEAKSAAGSNSADPPGRLVRPDVERDLVALKLAVEEDLATGRACQKVLKDEGMAP